MSADSKVCSRCGEVKPLSEYKKASARKDGYRPECKACAKSNTTSLLRESRRNMALSGVALCAACGRTKELQAFYLREDGLPRVYRCRECTCADKASDRVLNPEKYTEANKIKWLTQREKLAAKNKKYREKNKVYLYAKQKSWVEANYEAHREKDYERKKLRLLTDPVFAMKRRVRDLISVRLRNCGYTKKSRTHEILGCDWEFFKTHIERQFHKGMTWDNRRDWHLDHIRPIATATTEEHVVALNHFTNLRPMWAKDNLAKGALITHLI